MDGGKMAQWHGNGGQKERKSMEARMKGDWMKAEGKRKGEVL